MSRTTLITNSFIFFPPTVSIFFLYLLTPAICSIPVSGLLSCVEFLCVQMCARTFLFLRNLKEMVAEDPLTTQNHCR